MIAVGGYTRLSKSGLSMVRWKPINYKLPHSLEEWNVEFDAYKVRQRFQVWPIKAIPRVQAQSGGNYSGKIQVHLFCWVGSQNLGEHNRWDSVASFHLFQCQRLLQKAHAKENGRLGRPAWNTGTYRLVDGEIWALGKTWLPHQSKSLRVSAFCAPEHSNAYLLFRTLARSKFASFSSRELLEFTELWPDEETQGDKYASHVPHLAQHLERKHCCWSWRWKSVQYLAWYERKVRNWTYVKFPAWGILEIRKRT